MTLNPHRNAHLIVFPQRAKLLALREEHGVTITDIAKRYDVCRGYVEELLTLARRERTAKVKT